MSLLFIFFSVLSVFAVASAVYTISAKNPIGSALGLVVHFFMLAGLYLTLQAQFVAVIQILIYAGAIMVLVVFVIMLLNLQDEESFREKFNFRKGAAYLLAAVMVILLFTSISSAIPADQMPASAAQIGTVDSIGKALFNKYLFPFEAVSLLLLVAIVGSVLLAKRKID